MQRIDKFLSSGLNGIAINEPYAVVRKGNQHMTDEIVNIKIPALRNTRLDKCIFKKHKLIISIRINDLYIISLIQSKSYNLFYN